MSEQLNKSNLWYIKKQKKVTGPFPIKLIGSYLILGRIDIDTLVSPDKEKWQPIGHIPALIPNEVKNGIAVSGKEKLHQAKSRENERSGDTRRGEGHRRSGEREDDGRRQSDDRRQNNETVSASYLKLKSDFSAERVKGKRRRLIGVVGLVGIVSALILSFFAVEPVTLLSGTDCSVKAAAGVDWQTCNKNSVNLIAKNLENSNLHSTNFNGSLLVKTNFSGSNLSYANLENTNLSQAKFKDATLIGVNLNNSNLSDADLSGADLSYADLRNAIISNVRVLNTRFDNAIWITGVRCARQSIDECVPEEK